MKDMNLTRIMRNCCVDIDRAYFDELHNYLIHINVDLNSLNIDDLVVNGIQYLDSDELTENHYILSRDNDGAYILHSQYRHKEPK